MATNKKQIRVQVGRMLYRLVPDCELTLDNLIPLTEKYDVMLLKSPKEV